jgi:hypothetical protein
LHMFKMKGTNKEDPDKIFAKCQVKHHTRQSANPRNLTRKPERRDQRFP